VNINGNTALMLASSYGYEQIVRDLLATGESRPGNVDKEGHTALMFASMHGHEQIVRDLLATGESRPGKVNNNGKTTLTLASKPIIRRLILQRMILDEIYRRRFIQYKVLRVWTRLPGLSSPTSNQMFYDMGTQLRQTKTLLELQEAAPYATVQNYEWYKAGVLC
jgi:alpha-ketoglutarate-dependent taurine dioxygenase